MIVYICIINKINLLTHKNIKSEEFYSRFHNQLNESQNWPGEYLFKFIVKDNSDEFKSLKEILGSYKGKMNLKSSSNNKFISISFRYNAKLPNDVIEIYKKTSKIDNIISL